ncbi:MAG: VOC family protein [Magnetospiraceae bacterium]
MAVSGINLIVLRAKDPDRMRDFYTTLGLDFVEEKHGAGPRHHACDMDGVILEIYPCATGVAATTGTRLGFTVSSLAETLEALGDTPPMLSPPRLRAGTQCCVLEDPEGHRVELVETRASTFSESQPSLA